MAAPSIGRSTDVLVIGGGMAGCMAAYAARQAGAEVLLVDKAAVGYSGCSYFAAGTILCYVPEEDNLEEWVAAYAEDGAGLGEPAFIEGVLRETWEMVSWLDAQGVPISRTPDGRYRRVSGMGRYSLNAFAPMTKVMPLMRDLCQRVGVKIADRVAMAALIEEDGAVHGAVGFSPRSGMVQEIEARAVVLAAGGCGYRAHGPGRHMASGEGWRVAYEAGAVLANMEYSNNYSLTYAGFGTHGTSYFVGTGGKFINARGEPFLERYYPGRTSKVSGHELVQAIALEARAGHAPIYVDLSPISVEDRQTLLSHVTNLELSFQRASVDPFAQPLEVIPTFTAGSIAGLWIDDRCATSLRGLYAAGDVATSSRFAGARLGISGAGGAWAAVSGRRAGGAAAAAAREAKPLDAARFRSIADDLRSECLSQGRPEDAVRPHEAITALQRIILPTEVNLIRHGVRLEAALARLRNLAEELDLRLGSDDPHQRMVANEVRAMLLVAETQLLSAAARTESRGAHYREDYPARDDAHWRKNLLVKRGRRGPELSGRPVLP